MPWKKSSVIKILVGVTLVLLVLMALLSGDSIGDIASSSLEENINRIERKIYSLDIKIDKGNYKANEDLKIHLGRYVSDKLEIYVVDSLKRKTVLNYKIEGNDVVIEAPKHLPAGKSTLQIKDGSKLIYSQNFEWGVLALNTTKSAYTPGETAEIQMAVLDDQGEMVCNANTTLYIYDPDNNKTTLSTNDKTIQVTDFCDKKEFTLEPDYKASYKFEKKGKYRLELTAETKNGTKTIEEEIEVKESLDFEINRVTATRIYPVLEYPVTLNIKANRDFEGTIEEYIPDSFTLKDFDVVKPTITNTGIVQTLSYPVKLKKGETFSPKYSYDAPDDSPQFFTLGKISFKEADKEIYREDRMWQIAVDSAGASFPTRLYTTGFELNSVTAGMEWNTNTGTAPTISSTTIRTGGYALRTNPSGATSYIQYVFATADNATRTFLRAYFRTPSYPSSLTEIVSFVDNAGTIQASVQMTNTGTLRLFNNEDSAQIGSDTAAISVDTWYRVELETDFGTAATGDSIVAARLDGVQIASSTTVNFANGIARINIGAQATTSADFFFDDVGLNQDAYTNQNNWTGEGKVVRINPDGNGTNVAWTNDYTAVDEVTPNDATDYVLCSGNNQLEDYSLQSSTTAGIGVNDRVTLAEIWGRFGASAAGTQTHALSLLNAGGTGNTATAVTVTVATWSTNDDTNPINADMVIYDEPGATNYSPLNSSLIDGMQARITSADCSPFVWVSTVWVYVEYVPAEGGRVYSSGFELRSVTANMEWTSVDGSPTVITATKRSGDASMQVVTLGSGTREALNFQFVAANANGPYFLRAYIYITTAPSAENTIIDFRNSSSTIIARITMDNSRQLQLRDEDGTIGSVSSALSTTTWYRVELKVDASGGASADTVEAKLNGTVFGTSSTRDLSTGVYQFGLGGNLNAEAQTTGDWLFDDVALNQNVGSTQNGYPGAGKIVHLLSNANGDTTAWTNTYTNVDDIGTPDDSSTVISISAINSLEENNLEDSSKYSISSTTDDITLVSTGVRFDTSAVATMSFTVRLKDAAAGPMIESSSIMSLTNATFYTNNNTAPRLYPLTAYTRPNQITNWTTAALDSSQIGVRETLDTTSLIRVSTLWLLVEYKPAVITISGTCDAFDETTDCGDTGTIKVAVNTTVASQEQTTVAGTWQIDEVPKPASGDVITVWIGSASDTDEAVAVTQYDGTGNITGVKLFKEHLTIGSDDLQNLTNTEIGTYDNSVSTNEDIFFDVDTGVLYVDDTSQSTTEKLTILSGNTYTPEGNLTTHDIDNQGTFVPGSNTMTVQGSYSNQGTFTKGTSSINMTGTTTETLSGTMSGASGQFYNLTFNGSGGAWSFTSNPPVEVANDLTITLGTVTSSSTTLTIAGNYSNSGTFTHNSGTVIFAATDTGNTINPGSSSLYNISFTGSGTWSVLTNTLTVTNDFQMNAGTLDNSNGTASITVNGHVTCAGTCGTITLTSGTFTQNVAANKNFGTVIGTNVWQFNNLTFSQSSGTPTITISSIGTGKILVKTTLTISASTTLNAGNRTIQIDGTGSAFSVSGTFTYSTSTVNYEGNGSTTLAAISYYNLGVGTISDVNAAVTYTLGGTTNVYNILTVGNTGSTFTDNLAGSTYTLSFYGGAGQVFNITSKGNFSEGTSTVKYLSPGSGNNQTLTNTTNANDGNIAFGVGCGSYSFDNSTNPSRIAGDPNACNEATYNFLTFTLSSTIANGSTVSSAYLNLYGDSNTGLPLVKICVSDYSNASVPASTANLPTDGGGSTNTYPSTCSSGTSWTPGSWSTSGYNATADISSLIQYLVNTYSGLSSGNKINVWLESVDFSNELLYYTAENGSNEPQLVINVSGSQNITQETYYNLEASASQNDAKTTWGTAGSQTINVLGDLTVGNGSNTGVTSDGNTYNPTITVTGNTTINSNTTFTSTSGILSVGGNYSNSGTLTHNSGIIKFTATDAGNTIAGTLSGATGKFYNLTFDGSGGAWSFTSNPAVEVANDLTITNGTLTSTSHASGLTVTGNYSNSGTFTHNSGTMIFNATDAGNTLAGTLSGASSFYDLSFTGAAGAWSFTANPSVTIANALSISNGTLTATSGTTTIGGNFTKTGGTFTHNSGTVVFNDNTKVSTLTYNAATTFSAFTVSTASKQMKFDNVDQTNIAGTFTVTGSACGTKVELHSDSDTNQFDIDATGTVSIQYADIQDSNAITALSATNSVAGVGGNNTNWTITSGACGGGISVTGVCYAFDEVTGCGDTGTITIAFGNSVQAQTEATVSASWTVTGMTAPISGTVVTIFIDGAADTDEAIAVTKYDGTGDITGVKLYKENLTIGSVDNQTLSNSELGTFDNSVSGDEDIFFDVTTNNLVVDSTAQSSTEKLTIISGNTHQPGGNVTTHDLSNIGTFLPQGNTITIAGSYLNSGTVTSSTSQFNMTGTTTETLAGNLSGTSKLYNLTFNGSGGAWSFTSNPTVEIYNDLIITLGTVTSTSGNLAVGGNYSNSGTFTHNSGTVVFNGNHTSNTLAGTLSGSSSFYNLKFDKCPVVSSPVSFWNFEEGTGGTTADNCTNAFTGTLGTGGTTPTWTTGKYGNGLSFDGNDYVNIGSQSALQLNYTDSFSFSSWVNTPALPGSGTYPMVMNQTGPDSSYGAFQYTILFNGDDSGKLCVAVGRAGVGSNNVCVASPTSVDTWYHVMGVYDGTDLKMYVDGSYVNSVTYSQGAASAPAGDLIIGGSNNNFYYTGKIDNPAVYNYVLTPAQVIEDMNRAGGGWSYTSNPNVAVLNNFTITNGIHTSTSGSLTITNNYSNLGTFTHNSGTVIMNATDAGNTLSGIMSGSPGKFYNLTFNGSGGAWSFASNPAVEVANNLTITLGTVTSTSNTLTVTGNFSNSGTFTHNSGTTLFNATDSGNTIAGTLSGTSKFYNLTFNGSGGAWSFTSNPAVEVNNDLTITNGTVTSTNNTLTITGNYSNAGTFTHNGGTVIMNATDAGNTLGGTMTTTSSFASLTFNGSGGAWSFGANSATVTGNFTITLGTVTAPSTTLTISGNYSNAGTFTHNSGSVVMDGIGITDPTLYWNYQENTGTAIGSRVGGGQSGTTTGTAWTSGVYDYALDYNGSDRTYASNRAISATDNFTLMAWVNVTSLPQASLFMYNGSDSAGYGLGITNGWDGTGSELVALYGNVTWFGAGYTMPTNQWLHITLVRDSGTAKFYVNGVQTSGTNTNTPGSPADFFEVGNEPGQGRYFNGKVDEPKVYNYALTQAQVKSAMYTYYANTLGYTMSGNMTTTSSFNNLTFNGTSGVWDFGANSATVANDLTITAGSVVAPSSTLTVTGNYSNSGTFTHNSGTVTFNATDSGNTIAGTLSGATGKFYNLTFDGVSGAWSFTSNPAVEVNNNLTITNGTLTSTSNTLTVTGNYSNAGTFTHNSGTVTMNATDAGNTLAGTLSSTSSFYNLTFNGSGGAWSFTSNPAVEVTNDFTITLGTLTSTSGNFTVTGNYSNSGTFTHNSGTMIFNATDAGNTLAGTLSGGSSFYNLTFNGSGGAWSFTSNPAVEVANDFTITLGTITSTSGNFTVTGNYSNSGTFTHNSGTMIFNATDAGNTLAGTLSGATGMFYNLTFNGSGGAWSFTSNPAVEVNNDLTITAGTLTSTSNASALIVTGNYSNSGTFTHNSGIINFNSTATKTLAGTMSGSSGFYDLRFSGTGAWSFTGNPNVDVANYFEISNPSANVTSTSATLKVSGNFRNSFNTTTFVHNNGLVKFDATDAGNTITSTSSLSFYDVIFDGVGGAWQLPTGASTSVNNDLTITNGAVSPVGAGYSLNISGNYLNNGTFTNNGGTVAFTATDAGNTIAGTLSGANGKFNNITFSGSGGEWSFTGNPTVEVVDSLTISNGTLTSTSGNLIISRNFSKTGGTFTHNSGTVTFVDSGQNTGVIYNADTTFNNITVATPSKTIKFDEAQRTTVVGTFTINGSACGTPVVIKSWVLTNQADIDLQGTVSVDYASIEDSNAITAATANNSVVGAGGNNTNWTINGGVCNTAPNSPTSLAQKTTGDVVIVTGGWNNTTSIKFTATADDPNNPDTISLCVEYQQLGTGFTNTETGCGTGVAYSGTPVSVTVTLNSIPDAFEYHWQARLKDTAGAYSAWVSYDVNAESARDFGIDTTAPTLSTINDGTSCGSDVTFNNGSLSTISACWAQATATISGLEKYQYSVGTTSGATDVLTWTDLVDGSANVSLTINSLTLQTSQQYYINVKAVDNATNTSGVISTNGQLVAPTISFSLNSSAVTFANLNGGNSYTDTKTSTLTTSTNAYNGYVVRAYKTQLLTNTANPSYTIPDFSAGSYAAPSEWSGTGYGYSSSDTSIQGAGKFPGSGACLGTGNAPCFAPFSSTAPGDIVADHTATVSGSPISSEQFTITYKVATPATQAGGQYTTTIIYTIVPQY